VEVYSGPGVHQSHSLAYDLFGHRQHVDASPEAVERYQTHAAREVAAKLQAQQESEKARRQAILEAERKQPQKGRTCRVVKGRKVPKGTVGIVFWYGNTVYGMRVGLQLPNGERVFTAATNVEAIR
jgi:hypothetical protein